MQSIKLTVTSRSATGSIHATLDMNDNNTGALYLTSDELTVFTEILKSGAEANDVSFIVDDSLNCDQEIDNDPWDD